MKFNAKHHALFFFSVILSLSVGNLSHAAKAKLAIIDQDVDLSEYRQDLPASLDSSSNNPGIPEQNTLKKLPRSTTIDRNLIELLANYSDARRDLSLQYPLLKEVDRQNEEYSRTAVSFMGQHAVNLARRTSASSLLHKFGGASINSSASARTMDTHLEDNVFHLGQGFDSINSTYRNQCLNQSHPDFKILSDESNIGTSLEVKHVKSAMELYEALDTSLGLASSGAFSISGVDIEAGINLSSDRINAEYLDASHEVFVMRYTSMRKRYTLQTQPRPLKPEISSSFLRPDNQKTLQRDFFSECGDRYVDGVELGAALYVVFYFDTKTIKESERKSAAAEVNLAIIDILKNSLSSTRKSEINTIFRKYNVRHRAKSLGGEENISDTFTDHNQYADYLARFEQGINETNLKAVHEYYREYTLPEEYATADYYSVFENTSEYINLAFKYTALANQYIGLCNKARELNDILSANFNTKSCSTNALISEIQKGRQACGVSQQWDNCIHPGLYRTANNSLLMDKLSSDTPDFYETDISSRVAKQSVTGGVWNKKCISDVIELCLPVGCYENKPQSDNYKGYKYNEVSYKSPANSGGYRNTNADVYTNTSSARCSKVSIEACTHRVGGSKANFEFSTQMWGVCPTVPSFDIY